jgi:hypothetical protein
LVRPHFVVSLLNCIKKHRRRQKISAPARGNSQLQQPMVEALQSLLSERSSTATSALDSSSTALHLDERFFSSAVEQTCIVQAGHDAEQSVETSYRLGRTTGAPRTKYWQADVNDMGKAAESFAARSRDTVPPRDQIAMRDQPRRRAIFKGCDPLRGLRDC